MASVIVVDSEFKDSVLEYGQIIDGINKSYDFSESLKTFFNNDDISNKKELSKKIAESSSASNLTKLSDKEFEPTYNLIIYLLTQLEEPFTSYEQIFHKDSVIIKNLIESTPTEKPSIRDRKAIKYTTILSIFNTIFNFLPETSSTRIFIIECILNVVEKSNVEFTFIQDSIGKNLDSWLKNANASESEIKSIFWKFITLDKLHSLKSLQLIKEFTAKYAPDLNELYELIQFALKSETADVSFLINNNVSKAIAANKNDELVSFFQSYVKGDIIKTVPSALNQSSEDILIKSKILSLARFFIENDNNNKNVFKYTDIPSDLVTSNQDFEELLITSIKSGLIEGKLNQLDESFHLTKVKRFIIAGDEENLVKNWEYVRQALVDWRIALDNLDEIVNTSREEIVSNNSN